MKILKDETAARLAQLLAKGGQNGPTRAVRRSGPSAPSPRLFDLCFKQIPGGEPGALGIHLFVGCKEADASSLADAVRVNGRAVDCAWPASLFDWNPDSPWQWIGNEYNAAPPDGTAVWIVFGLANEAWSSRKWGDAANGGASGDLVWEPVVGTLSSPPDHPASPSGAANPHYLHPVLVGFWKDGVGLVQCHAGPVEITVEVPDTDAAGTDADPARKSIERASDATLAVRGWTSPETCPSAALTASDGSASAGAPDNSLLVRSALDDGDSIRMRYLLFSDLLSALDRRFPRKGTPLDGEGGVDPIEAVYDLTCPTGHDRTTPLVYYFNPCDLLDGQGNVLQRAGLQHGQFWPVGGSAAQCKGSSIGDSNGNDAIHLDGRTLYGCWIALGGLIVGDQAAPADLHVSRDAIVEGRLNVSGESALGNASTGNLNVGGTLTLGSGAGATDVGAALNALFGRVTTVENSLSGLETLLSQI